MAKLDLAFTIAGASPKWVKQALELFNATMTDGEDNTMDVIFEPMVELPIEEDDSVEIVQPKGQVFEIS